QVSLGDTIAFSPKTILDLHIGFTRYVYLRTPLSQGIDLSKFGPHWKALTSQMTYTHIPTVCVAEKSGDNHWGNNSWCSQGTGNGLASFLLGYGDNGSVTEPARTADQIKYGALYAGDTYQLTRKITLNLGIRVDLQGDWTERFNRIVVFNPNETSPLIAASPAV